MPTILFLALMPLFFLPSTQPVAAQQPTKIPRVGIVSGSGGAELRQGLRELGCVEGKNILVDSRGTLPRDHIPQFVTELVRSNVDVLVVRAQPAIRAAKQATKTIPIVMVTTQDPVAQGFVSSLARPGGNITGLTSLQRELSGKRLELLKELLPGVSRVAALMNSTSTGDFKNYEAAARALKIQLQSVGVKSPKPNLEAAFQTAAQERAGAVIAVTNALLNPYTEKIAELAVKHRLPLIAERDDYTEAGGLMSYAADDDALWRRAAVYVDKILKGTKPADIPVEQPTKFEFIINLKTAKRIGITIPPEVLVRASRVIQ